MNLIGCDMVYLFNNRKEAEEAILSAIKATVDYQNMSVGYSNGHPEITYQDPKIINNSKSELYDAISIEDLWYGKAMVKITVMGQYGSVWELPLLLARYLNMTTPFAVRNFGIE